MTLENPVLVYVTNGHQQGETCIHIVRDVKGSDKREEIIEPLTRGQILNIMDACVDAIRAQIDKE